MLILPSGRITDLSIDRAKHHAMRLNGPRPDACHRDLYALVDILYRFRDDAGSVRRGHTEFDYIYSGYTLADVLAAEDWSQADKQALMTWVREKVQHNLIETSRRRLSPHQPLLTLKQSSAPSRLYSLLQQRLQALPLQQATARQWRATLENMCKKGLKAEELEYSGLPAFLAGLGDEHMLHRQSLLGKLRFQNIQPLLTTELMQKHHGNLNFQEVAQCMPHQAVRRAALRLDQDCLCILRFQDAQSNYRVGVIKARNNEHHMALNKFWFALDSYGRAIKTADNELYFSSSDDAIIAANRHASQHIRQANGYLFHTRYDHLTLHGGHDYREWLISLSDYQRTFFGAHHFDHNVLVHVRTTTRSDTQGRKLLFIEEIQSDWHQQGKRHGYDNNPWGRIAHAPFKNEWPLLGMKLMLIRASQNGYDGIAWCRGEIQELRYGRTLPGVKRHYDQEIPAGLDRLCRPYAAHCGSTRIETCDPWLNLVKEKDKWRVEDHGGKFRTRTRYRNREAAMAVLYRHSRRIEMEVPVLFITTELRRQISEHGLPMFGTTTA